MTPEEKLERVLEVAQRVRRIYQGDSVNPTLTTKQRDYALRAAQRVNAIIKAANE